MGTRLISIKGNYDTEKTTRIRVKTGNLINPTISHRAYKSAITRMGLIGGDYPRLAEDFPAIVVLGESGEKAIIS